MRFRVTYGDPDELVTDFDQQLSKGGFLVRVQPPSELALFTPTSLVVAFLGQELVLEGNLLQVIPSVGVAVSVANVGALAELLARARAMTGSGGTPAGHTIDAGELLGGDDSQPSTGAAGTAPLEPHQKVKEASKQEQIKMARYGGRTERMLIMRGTDVTLHRFVLNNPQIGLDEVKAIASMNTVPIDTLNAIADRAEWCQRPDIALALVRNPKTPIPAAIKLLRHVAMGDLRQLSKSGNLRTPLLRAVRKLVLN